MPEHRDAPPVGTPMGDLHWNLWLAGLGTTATWRVIEAIQKTHVLVPKPSLGGTRPIPECLSETMMHMPSLYVQLRDDEGEVCEGAHAIAILTERLAAAIPGLRVVGDDEIVIRRADTREGYAPKNWRRTDLHPSGYTVSRPRAITPAALPKYFEHVIVAPWPEEPHA